MRFPDVLSASFQPITLIEIPDEEEIIRARMLKVKERWTEHDPPLGAAYDVEALEFDPIKITMEAGASFEMNALTRVNQMGRATTLAFAWGANLDAIASRYPGGVPRLPSETYAEDADPGEKQAKDNRYRKRIWLAPNALAASGTAESYQYWAMTFDGDLKDASAIVKRPSLQDDPVVIVTCLANGDDPVPSQERLIAIRAGLHRTEIKPLTDVISVRGPVVVKTTYSIGLYLYPDVSKDYCEGLVKANLDALVVDQYWLDQDHTQMQISAACAVPGVHSIKITTPLSEIDVDETGAILVEAVSVKTLGRKK